MEKQNGITLIALVITIIVLIILAGISIQMLTGENGIITKVQQAKNETEIAQEKERQDLEKIYTKMNLAISGDNLQNLTNEELQQIILDKNNTIEELQNTISTKNARIQELESSVSGLEESEGLKDAQIQQLLAENASKIDINDFSTFTELFSANDVVTGNRTYTLEKDYPMVLVIVSSIGGSSDNVSASISISNTLNNLIALSSGTAALNNAQQLSSYTAKYLINAEEGSIISMGTRYRGTMRIYAFEGSTQEET